MASTISTLHLQDYCIYLINDWIHFRQFLKDHDYSQIVLIVDENTKVHCLPIIGKHLEAGVSVIEIKSGEIHKQIGTCKQIWREMLGLGIDRQAVVINLGGGVIGDMGGFCASTFKRGVDFIQIPTTLLAQVDASIGGKLGIDFAGVKNSIGVFRNPQAVFIAPVFLETLPLAEIRSGFAEIIKHSLIADQQQWQAIKKTDHLESIEWIELIEPSLQIKQQIVEADPFERGLRKALNFGHTIGHAVESLYLTTENPLLHGEAIAIGMICESWLSCQLSTLNEAELTEISAFLVKMYGKHPLRETDFPALLSLMRKDKKNEQKQINFTMLNGIGNALINQVFEDHLIIESLLYYNTV